MNLLHNMLLIPFACKTMFFFFFLEKIAFGYCFSLCVVRLTTSWNELEPNGYKKKIVMEFVATSEKGMEFH
jgi:hypothetical protein